MIILHLTRGDTFTRVPLCLPADAAEINRTYEDLDDIGSPAPTKAITVLSPIDNLIKYIGAADLDDRDEVATLNRLAELMDRMTQQELDIFSGALEAEKAHSVRSVMAVAENLDAYTLVPGAANDHELGNFLVKTGYLNVAEHLLPHINYSSVGKEYRDNFGGAYGQGGYVRRKSVEPALDQDRDAVFIAHLYRSGGQGAVDLKLPASDAWLDHAKQVLGISEFCQAKMRTLEHKISDLSELLPAECISVEDANDLAYAIERMQRTDGELLKFCSVLSVEGPETFPAALVLAKSLHNYKRVPIGAKEYGKQYLESIGMDEEMLDTIDGYMDFREFGKAQMEEDGVVRTKYGAVKRLSSPFDSQSPGGMQMV